MKNIASAVFLDRDGVINEDSGYVDSPMKVKLLANAAEGIKTLRDGGFKIIIISNQSGVARGFFNEKRLEEIDARLRELLDDKDASVDAVYYCPHHPEESCDCRKPQPGMILKAASDLGIDLSISFLVGDSLSDIEAGRKANLKAVVLIDGARYRRELREGNSSSISPDVTVSDLLKAARWIVESQ